MAFVWEESCSDGKVLETQQREVYGVDDGVRY